MKTVAQWAEQLPELIKIEFLKECKIHELNLKRKRENLSEVFWLSFWWLESYTELGSEFWQFVRNELIDETNYSDYLDESVPYTKEEVEAMILEFADPNDEVCKVMLANVGKSKEVDFGKCDYTSISIDLTTNDGIYSRLKLVQENEALKSTIEGLNAIVAEKKHYIECLESDLERKTKDLYGTIERNDWLHKERYPLYRDLCDTKGQLKLAKERIKELEQPVGRPETNERPTLFNRFLNLFK